MRYILIDGYIDEVLFSIGGVVECKGQISTDYTGAVPSGYSNLKEWAEIETENRRLNAWKIVDDNLVFDPKRNEMLQEKYEKDSEDNRFVCYKEISNINNITKTDNANNYKRSTTDLLNILEVTDSNKYVSEYIKLIANENISGSVTIKFNNGNLLTNDATSKTESGISFVVNSDRSIQVSGTATEDIEFNIGGTSTNTKPILVLKKNTDYYLSSNNYQIKMYNYDGTDRTEVYSSTGGFINLSSDNKVTNIVLCIPSGTKVNTTIYPMLSIGTTEVDYITYQGNETIIYLDENLFNTSEKILIENGSVNLLGSVLYPSRNVESIEGLKPSTTLTPSTTLKPNKEVKEQTALYPSDTLYAGFLKNAYLDDVSMPYTYLDKTYMYAYEDVQLMVTYPNTEKDLDLCGYETPNKGFSVDEEGNITCNNATMNNVDIKGTTIKLNDDTEIVGNSGVLTNLQFRGTSNNAIETLGFYIYDVYAESEKYRYADVLIDAYIPENFTIKEAKIIYEHTPVYWLEYESQTYIWGYSRNINAYKITNNTDYQYGIDAMGGMDIKDGTISKTLINGSYYQPTNTSGAIMQTHVSSDIKSSLTSGNNRILLRSSDAIPTTNSVLCQKTGVCKATLYVIGYYKI